MNDHDEARDDVMGSAVAFLRAGMNGDEEGGTALLDTVDTRDLCGFLGGLVAEFGCHLYGGPDRFAAVLAAWQPGQNLGDGFER